MLYFNANSTGFDVMFSEDDALAYKIGEIKLDFFNRWWFETNNIHCYYGNELEHIAAKLKELNAAL